MLQGWGDGPTPKKDPKEDTMQTNSCPTPEKMSASTLKGAALNAIWVYESRGEWHRPYPCRCGEYHLTSTMPDGRTPVSEAAMDALFAAVL